MNCIILFRFLSPPKHLPVPPSLNLLCHGPLTRYENTERRKAQVAEKGLLYLGMGVSGGEEGARNGETCSYQKSLACD